MRAHFVPLRREGFRRQEPTYRAQILATASTLEGTAYALSLMGPRAAGAAAVVAVLAGSASAASAAPVRAVPNVLPPSLQYLVRPLPRGMAPRARITGAKGGGTVFVSDVNNSTVTCFNERGKVTGQITGLDGLFSRRGSTTTPAFCTSDTADSNILEFQGCSPKPIAMLSDAGQFPVDVTRSPDGNVYASNIDSFTGAGSISVYPPGATSPSGTVNAGPNEARNYFITTDSSGNVYSDWFDLAGVAHVQCYPTPVTSPGIDQGIPLGFPGGIKWYAGHLVVSDQATAIDGYAGGSCSGGGWKLGPQIFTNGYDWIDIALNANASAFNRTDVNSHNADQLAYPGGDLRRQFVTGFSEPVGVANSLEPKR